jgi:proteasome component ECM29
MDEIIEFLHPHLNSPYWRMKQTAALTIADLCKTSGKALGAHVNKVMPIMVATLNTRYWAGKETVLDAFVQLCLSSPTWFDGNTSPSLDEAYQVSKCISFGPYLKTGMHVLKCFVLDHETRE